jgi:hypothetical protein
MPSLVGRNDVQTRGQAESNAANERVGEAHSSQIDLRVAPQERAHLVLRGEKLAERIVQRRSGARSNALRRLASESRLQWSCVTASSASHLRLQSRRLSSRTPRIVACCSWPMKRLPRSPRIGRSTAMSCGKRSSPLLLRSRVEGGVLRRHESRAVAGRDASDRQRGFELVVLLKKGPLAWLRVLRLVCARSVRTCVCVVSRAQSPGLAHESD